MANRSLSDRLFSGVYPTGIVYADRARARGGDYERVAFLSFSTLDLEVARGQEKSPLLPLVREDAARLQARRGQRYEVSASGQYVVLGHDTRHGRLAGSRSESARSARGRSAGRTGGITGKQLFDEALPKIESPSVRKWAESNRATFEQIGARSLERRPYDRDSATRFATYITIRAMEG